MPTVLDSLREHLLGDELTDRLEQWLATIAAEKKMKLAAAIDSAEAGDPDAHGAGLLAGRRGGSHRGLFDGGSRHAPAWPFRLVVDRPALPALDIASRL